MSRYSEYILIFAAVSFFAAIVPAPSYARDDGESALAALQEDPSSALESVREGKAPPGLFPEDLPKAEDIDLFAPDEKEPEKKIKYVYKKNGKTVFYGTYLPERVFKNIAPRKHDAED